MTHARRGDHRARDFQGHAMAFRRSAFFPLVLLLVLSLGACKRAEPPGAGAGTAAAANHAAAGTAPVEADPGPGTAAEPLELGDFKIVSVLLGRSLDADQVVQGDREAFSPRDTIHASVLSTGAHDGLTLSARWIGPGGAPVAQTAQVVAPTQPTATTFSLENPQPWPPGDYKLELAVNEQVLQTREFHIR
jgi:hypothetical protein